MIRRMVWVAMPLLILFHSCGVEDQTPYETGTSWPTYQGDLHRNQYSPLSQINTGNVSRLKIAWTFHTYDSDPEGRTQIQCNPLVIGGVLYGTSPKLKCFALDAATGKQLWMFDPAVKTSFALNVNRGVAYWTDGTDSRIFYTAGPYLFALDAKRGQLVRSFGIEGRASLKASLGARAQQYYVVSTTPGTVYKNLLIIGTRVSEGEISAPGYIRAYDVHTGKVAWTFHTIPQPGEFGHETWPEDAWERIGGANNWSGMSLDPVRGVVYIPTGSAAYDFYGGNRKGANLFANCILALDAGTGERLWHYQTVHHDLWDRDLPAPPNLVTVNHQGRPVDAVAQITKSGYVFLLDRDTGKPLFPVEQRPVPASDLMGEEAWPTQPVPLKPPPFARQRFTMGDVTDISVESHAYVAGILQNLRTGNPFIPPSKQGTIIFPGFDGGGEWGGAAVDPQRAVLYVNSNEMPWILTMFDVVPSADAHLAGLGAGVYTANCAMCHGPDRRGDPTGTYPNLVDIGMRKGRREILEIIREGRNFMPGWKHLGDQKVDAVLAYLLGEETPVTTPKTAVEIDYDKTVPYRHTGYNRFFDHEGYPAIKPPWGNLTAIDLNEGSILWQVPLGEFEALTARGVPKTGTENYGGPVVTAGGLLFIAASQDEYFRAFDRETGEELWKHKLPAGGYATPSVYAVNGRQYAVIACGGGKMGTPSGDAYVAFALED